MTLKLPYSFESVELLRTALTHKSFHNENSEESVSNNERLEFLGDAVIGLVLSHELMSRYPSAHEGELSKWRASLVNESSLAELGQRWDLAAHLRLGKGEAQTNGTGKPRIIASAFEAVVGAVFVDGGYINSRSLVLEAFKDKLSVEFETAFGDRDFKTRLQELTQEKFKVTPRYDVIKESGPDHDKNFVVCVFVEDKNLAQGEGRSKKQAAQAAAQKALEVLS